MTAFRSAHVVTCWVYLAALALLFTSAGDGVAGAGMLVLVSIPLALVVTAWLGGLGRQQALLGFGLLVVPMVPGLHPALALLNAGFVVFWLLEPALDAGRATTARFDDRQQIVPMT